MHHFMLQGIPLHCWLLALKEKLMLWPPIPPWPQPFWASWSKITTRVGDIDKVILTTPTALIVQGKTAAEQQAQVFQWKQPRFGEGDVTPQGEGQPRSDNHKECNAAPRKMPLPRGLYREHCKLVQSGYKLTRSIKKCTARTRGEKVEVTCLYSVTDSDAEPE